jgi:hypothetical protein
MLHIAHMADGLRERGERGAGCWVLGVRGESAVHTSTMRAWGGISHISQSPTRASQSPRGPEGRQPRQPRATEPVSQITLPLVMSLWSIRKEEERREGGEGAFFISIYLPLAFAGLRSIIGKILFS